MYDDKLKLSSPSNVVGRNLSHKTLTMLLTKLFKDVVDYELKNSF